MTDTATGLLLHGYDFGADGAPAEFDWDHLVKGPAEPETGWRWIHLDFDEPDVLDWLNKTSKLDPIVISALTADSARPRCVSHSEGVLLNMRGVNLNPGAEPEDMISVRMWLTGTLVVSATRRRLKSIADLASKIDTGTVPATPGSLVTYIAERLVDRIDPVVAQLDDVAASYEDDLLSEEKALPRSALAEFRREVLGLRRYVIPQREALSAFIREGSALLTDNDKLLVRETSDQITRLAEDLDTIRERAAVMQEQIVERRAEAMNDRLFVLSIISAVFLPLGFVTGLFGINVGGMPGMNNGFAFALVCLFCLLLTGILMLVFRRIKWI